MKKSLSILTVLFMVTAMLHFSVAKHYCGGKLVALKLSFSGSPATCGMEGENVGCEHDHDRDKIDSHCCDDVITSYSIDNNYTPALKVAAGPDQIKFQTPVKPFKKPASISLAFNISWSDVSPPGEFPASPVDLPQLGVFRI